MDLFTTRHKVVHKGGATNFKGLLFDKKTNYLVQILQSLSYKVCSIILPKFNTFELFILILGASTIMDQTACRYSVTTSETGLYGITSNYEEISAKYKLKWSKLVNLQNKIGPLTNCSFGNFLFLLSRYFLV